MSGAAETCAAPPPATVAQAFAARPAGASGDGIAYVERTFHPALPDPVEARGTLSALPDGTLVRDQTRPVAERTEIGDRFVAVTRAGGAGPNLLPLPPEMRAFADALRAIVAGSAEGLDARFSTRLETGPEGWRLHLDPMGEGAAHLTLEGCGAVLAALGIEETTGTRRRILFGPAP